MTSRQSMLCFELSIIKQVGDRQFKTDQSNRPIGRIISKGLVRPLRANFQAK